MFFISLTAECSDCLIRGKKKGCLLVVITESADYNEVKYGEKSIHII
jgi:hypothetical protein